MEIRRIVSLVVMAAASFSSCGTRHEENVAQDPISSMNSLPTNSSMTSVVTTTTESVSLPTTPGHGAPMVIDATSEEFPKADLSELRGQWSNGTFSIESSDNGICVRNGDYASSCSPGQWSLTAGAMLGPVEPIPVGENPTTISVAAWAVGAFTELIVLGDSGDQLCAVRGVP